MAVLLPEHSNVARPHPRCCLAPPAEVHRNGNELFFIFKKMVLVRQEYVQPKPFQSGCEGTLSSDQFKCWAIFSFHSLQYAHIARHTLNTNLLQTLALSRNQRIHPQIRSSPYAA